MALEQRMYHLVLYNISPIQQGIQAGHAKDEYEIRWGHTPEYDRWIKQDKTVIILNGGTSNQSGTNKYNGAVGYGTMEQHYETLDRNGVKFAAFYEPDLNNATTAIAFLCDETVWDKKKYPDADIDIEVEGHITLKKLDEARGKLRDMIHEGNINLYGAATAFLRQFLSQFRLA